MVWNRRVKEVAGSSYVCTVLKCRWHMTHQIHDVIHIHDEYLGAAVAYSIFAYFIRLRDL